MKAEEIKEFLDNCGLDPNEKLTTHNDSWWVLKDLIGHAFEVSAQQRFDSLSKAPEKEEEKWISVEDRLPELLQKVKVKFDDSVLTEYMKLCETEDSTAFCYMTGDETIRKVTHWQPLPAPPKN